MMMLITYDVDMTTPAGAKRLRKVAKICENFGMRVQNSVFELLIDPAQLVGIKAQLTVAIDKEKDSGWHGYPKPFWMGSVGQSHQKRGQLKNDN